MTGTLHQYIQQSMHADGFQTVTHAGGGILLFGLVLGIVLEWKKFYEGQPANWMAPILHTLIIAAVLGLYPYLINLITAFVGSFGDLASNADKAGAIFKERHLKLLVVTMKGQIEGGNGLFGVLSVENLKMVAVNFVALLLSIITIALITALKFIQAMVLRVLVYLGPVMISLGVLPGPFRNFPANWVMLFFSISFWSVVMNAMLSMMAGMNSQIQIASEISLLEEITNAVTWIMLIIGMPALTTALVYGGGFGPAIGEAGQVITAGVQASSFATRGSQIIAKFASKLK